MDLSCVRKVRSEHNTRLVLLWITSALRNTGSSATRGNRALTEEPCHMARIEERLFIYLCWEKRVLTLFLGRNVICFSRRKGTKTLASSLLPGNMPLFLSGGKGFFSSTVGSLYLYSPFLWYYLAIIHSFKFMSLVSFIIVFTFFFFFNY